MNVPYSFTAHARDIFEQSVDPAKLAERIREHLAATEDLAQLREQKMFGGIVFFLNGNMLVGVWKEFLIVRLGPDQGDKALLEPHVRKMDITGKPMKGWIMVEPEGVENDDQLDVWIQRAVKFVGTLAKKSRNSK